jgi:hypothetical protein
VISPIKNYPLNRVNITMTVRNTTASPIVLTCKRPPYSNDLTIVDDAGKKVSRGVLVDSVPGVPRYLGGPTGLPLDPGGVGTCMPISNIRYWGFSDLPVGHYTITATHFEPST